MLYPDKCIYMISELSVLKSKWYYVNLTLIRIVDAEIKYQRKEYILSIASLQ